MLLRRYTKIVVYTITILVAMLLSDYLVIMMEEYVGGKSYKAVALKMLIIVVVYFPVFSFLEKYIKKVSTTYTKTSKMVAKSSMLGLTIGFSVALFLLFVMFSLLWYDMNVFNDVQNTILGVF